MKFRVKAKEVWEWEFEIEAESKEELKERLEEEFSELCPSEEASDYNRDWTIKEVKDEHT